MPDSDFVYVKLPRDMAERFADDWTQEKNSVFDESTASDIEYAQEACRQALDTPNQPEQPTEGLVLEGELQIEDHSRFGGYVTKLAVCVDGVNVANAVDDKWRGIPDAHGGRSFGQFQITIKPLGSGEQA